MRFRRSVVTAASIFVLAVAPYAHAADTSAFGIDDPLTGTLGFWSAILTSIESIAHELATTLIPNQPAALTNPPVLQQPSLASAASATLASESLSQSATSSESTSTATSDQTTQSPFVKAAALATSNQATPSPFVKSPELSAPSATSDIFVTQAQFNAAMSALGVLVQQLLATSNPKPVPEYIGGNGNFINPYAAANAIDNLSNVTITNPTISGGNITATAFSGLLGVEDGGTGIATSPSYGELLLGNGSGSYSLVATSSLGISGGLGTVGSGSQGQFAFYNAAGTILSATSSLFLAQNGKVGIGTTTPLYSLDVNGTVNVSGGTQAGPRNIGLSVGGGAPGGQPGLGGLSQIVITNDGNSSNLFVGNVVGASTTGSIGYYNTIVGLSSGANIPDASSGGGYANSFFGFSAGNANTTGFGNVFFGNNAGFQNTTGNGNTVVGTNAGYNLTTGSYNIAIGNDGYFASTTGSNQLNIQNIIYGVNNNGTGGAVSSGSIGIGTKSPYSRLQVTGPDTASTSAFAVVNSASTTELSVLDNGNATLAGNLIQNSDQRLKTNIQPLDSSSSLAAIDSLNPVTFNWIDPNKGLTPQLGFIAQQVLPIFPNLISTTTPTPLTPNGTLSLNYIGLISPIVSAIQALSSEITSIENTVAGFAQSFTTHILTADDITANQELCIGNGSADPDPVCVTKTQLAALLSQSTIASIANPSPTGGASNLANSMLGNDASSTTADPPPVIQVNGDNPAVIQVSATYTDIGATITGPQQDLNLGLEAIVDGGATTTVGAIEIDTSQPGTHTIEYVATDQNGLEGAATRTVSVVATPDSGAASSSDATSTTGATSSAQ